MRFSLRAIELCKMKFGKGEFHGFEQTGKPAFENLTEESVKKDFEELTGNGILDISNEEIHISALGHHIFYMMTDPEQYIMVNNDVNAVCVRVYIRNAYYLCIIENKKIKSDDDYDRYLIKLLPRLELVVGAFIHAARCTENIHVEGKAWNKERELVAEMQNISADNTEELVNQITEWMLGNMALLINEEVN